MSEPTEEPRGPAEDDALSRMTTDALRLIGSAQDWARRAFADPAAGAQAHADGHTGPDCQWCPLCQFVAVLRGERPELTERVTEAGAALATALRAAFETAAPRPQPNEPRVQHIDLGGDEQDGAGSA